MGENNLHEASYRASQNAKFSRYWEGAEGPRRGLNKEPMKPGNGGKENKILFFLVSWLPYCNIPSQLNQRYVAQFLVAASSFWLNHHKIDVRPG